jgi:hypothetical protein
MVDREAGSLTASGHIDEIDYIDVAASAPHEQPTIVPKGAILTVRGWAVLAEEPAGTTGVYAIVDDGSPLEALYGLERDDIAELYGSDVHGSCGFKAVLSTSHLAPGQHTLSLAVRDAEGRLLAVPGSESFTIESSLDRLVLEAPESESWTPIAVDSCAVDDEFAEEPLVAGPASIVSIRGWAVDSPAGTVASAVFGVAGSLAVKAAYGFPREDVVADQGGAEFRRSGFALDIPADELGPGSHAVLIRAVGADGETVYDGPIVRIDVSGFDAESALVEATASLTKASIDEIAVFDADGNVRVPSGEVRLARGEQLFVRGWAIDEVADATARAVHLCIDDLASTAAVYGLDRGDVATVFGRPDLAACGFTALLSTASLGAGAHEVAVRVIDREGRRYYDAQQRIEFTIEDAG